MSLALTLSSALHSFVVLWDEAVGIWIQGGWAMVGIAVIGLVMFAMGVHVYLALRGKGFLTLSESTWRNWIDHPEERRGPVGKLLDAISGGRSLDDTVHRFEQQLEIEKAPFERDLTVMRVCVGAAPLVGLLGTVTGMLATFDALSSGSGGDETMRMIARGVSEALITTETGLVIALPGLFVQYRLMRKYERYKAFLAHLESVCTQMQYRGQSLAGSAA